MHTSQEEPATPSRLSHLEDLPYRYHLVETDADRRALADRLLGAAAFAMDTETTNAEPMWAELVGMSFSLEENEAYYVPVPAERSEEHSASWTSSSRLRRIAQDRTEHQV